MAELTGYMVPSAARVIEQPYFGKRPTGTARTKKQELLVE